MMTMELWERPMFAALSVEEVTVLMVPIVREFSNGFLDDLPNLPPDREIEFGIDVLPGPTLISKVLYRMVPMELHELKIQL